MYSMTGFAEQLIEIDNYQIVCEIKTLNSRFLTINISVPDQLSSFESKIYKMATKYLKRGTVSCRLSLEIDSSDQFDYDKKVSSQKIETIKKFIKEFDIDQNLTINDIVSIFNPFEINGINFSDNDSDLILKGVQNCFKTVVKYREDEGKTIFLDLENRVRNLKKVVEKLSMFITQQEIFFKDTIFKKVEDIIEDHNLDKGRVEQEIIFYINRHDFSEEVERLKSHCDLFEKTIKDRVEIGRKLDFILQEINREANTIASKAKFKDCGAIVVDIKSEIEKMKEQVQNVE